MGMDINEPVADIAVLSIDHPDTGAALFIIGIQSAGRGHKPDKSILDQDLRGPNGTVLNQPYIDNFYQHRI